MVITFEFYPISTSLNSIKYLLKGKHYNSYDDFYLFKDEVTTFYPHTGTPNYSNNQ